ncbi:MAG: hypothetical protein ACE5KE_06380 [Methanosarcinales archaeon]
MELIKEIMKGTRGGNYYYVIEDSELVHISEYAIGKSCGKRENEIIYEVSKDRLLGKIIYKFSFSRSGNFFLKKCRIEDFKNGHPEKCEQVDIDILGNLNLTFRTKNKNLNLLQKQFLELFIPMIDDLKAYEKSLSFNINFMGKARRVSSAYKDPKLYYFEFMSIPNDKGRINSLKVVRRWLYQLWILKLICESLKVSKFKEPYYEGKSYWWIEQGSDHAACIGETLFGDVSFWFEFQPTKGAHLMGLMTEKRVPIRPDIVIVKGHFEKTDKLIEEKPINLIIECKVDPFERWKNEVEPQVLQYKKIFKPNKLIVVSLESVPDNIKGDLEREEIKTIDKLTPDSTSINMLNEFIQNYFNNFI